MQNSLSNTPIALVGMACRLPGADDLEGYWRVIRDGVSTAQRLPESRFDRSLYFDPRRGVQNRSYSDIGCLVNYDARSPYFDDLPAAVREFPEVAYRTLCDVAAEALADARLERRPSVRRSGGVYLGHARNSGLVGQLTYGTCIAQTAPLLKRVERFRKLQVDHEQIIDELVAEVRRDYPHRDDHGAPKLGAHSAAAMLAHTFKMNGPCIAFNSACASSLNAFAQATRALQQGRIEVAMVGGASFCHYETLVMFSQAQSLSGEMSRPFDNDADGLIVGEGYTVVILKTLEQALQDGDSIHAVVRGIGLASDGKGKSLWAPRKEGQIAAIRRAYGADLTTRNLQYIEAHATSTQLGDATEVSALGEAIDVPAGRRIPIGSVKANIGHTLENAGLSGLIKAVLCLKNRTIAPAANVKQLNEKIDWEASPFYVPLQAEPWTEPADGGPRRAAVNAFGIGGLNVHVVLDEFDAVNRRIASSRKPTASRVRKTPDESIAVVGRGAILPGALGVDAFAQLLASGRNPKGELQERRLNRQAYVDREHATHWRCLNNLAGEVKGFEYDWRKHKIPPKQIADASPLQFMILEAVDAAMREAGLDQKSMDRSRVGVVVGTGFGGEFGSQLLMGLRLPEFQKRLTRSLAKHGCDEETSVAISQRYAEVLVKELPALLDETGSFTSSSLASRVTKSFDLMGGGVAIDAGDCSSSAALACCLEQLRSGDCDMMICVGGHEDLSPARFEQLGLAGVLAREEPRSPFDADANGSAPGEGCGAIVLMRLDDANREHRTVYGIVRGIGAATADSRREASQQAVTNAFAQANQQADPPAPSDVARIEYASMASPARTAEELEGIEQGYAERANHPVSLDSVMTQIGHVGAAASMASLIKSSLEFQSLKTTGNFGLTKAAHAVQSNPLFDVKSQAEPLHAPNGSGRLVAAIHSVDDRTAYHILIERGAKVHAPSERSDLRRASANTEIVDGIPIVDATRRRKDAMLEKSKRQPLAASNGASATKTQSDAAPKHDAALRSNALHSDAEPPNAAPLNAEPLNAEPLKAEVHAKPVPAASDTAEPTSAQPAKSRADLSKPELKTFLINFVVEQTGYPSEFVEMDADLEADLGIDSLRKAQMFGELGDRFSVAPDENLTLDQFPTLQHIFDYLAAPEGTSPSSYETTDPREAAVDAPAPVVSAPEPPAESQPVSPQRLTRHQGNGAEKIDSATSAEQLERLFIDFIAEQTGYPADLLEMDAQLESDLGIDSIKKGQLFAELGEEFFVATNGNTAIEDFKTLRHFSDYLLRAKGLETSCSAPSNRQIAHSHTTEPSVEEATASRSQPRPANSIEASQEQGGAESDAAAQDRQLELIPDLTRLKRTMDLLAYAGLSIPYFSEHECVTQDTTRIDGGEVITFSSSNYLGLSGDPTVSAGAKEAVDQYGTSVSASRLVAGKPIHRELEEELAAFLGAEATLVFSSGYSANESTIGHLFGPGDLIIHDSLAHNCIIQGAIQSGAQRLNFPHNDTEALDRQLNEIRHKYRRVLIAIEGAYSMDGDYPDLPRFLELKLKHRAFLLVDDAHAIGTMGATGRGIPEFFNIDPSEIDLWVGTLSKAFGSCGGFVSASRDVIQYLKHSVPGFIYTVALSPAAVGAALAALRLLQREPHRVTKLQSNTQLLLELAKERGLDTGPAGDTPVVPIMVGNSHAALLLSRSLLDRGIDIRPIVYPAVEPDAARLRFMITAKHTPAQIRMAIDALAEDLKRVASESVPDDQWKSIVTGKVALPDDAAETSMTEKTESAPAEETPQRIQAGIAAPEPAVEGAMETGSNSMAPTENVANPQDDQQAPDTASQTEANSAWSKQQLEEFLINFVVEQTGYPPEFVEMDADLEADLGIDSLRKAQLIGELAQHFDIAPDETLTLDDFPTLQHVFDYITVQMGITS